VAEPVIIVDYDPAWPSRFEALRARLAPALEALGVQIVHVGSTSVPGLAAKPVIDLNIVLRSAADLPSAIERLAALGYVHEGDLGIAGREAFATPPGYGRHDHHLYVCAPDWTGHADQIAFRDYLRAHRRTALAYARLKRSLAQIHRTNRSAYANAKAGFVAAVLRRARAALIPLSLLEQRLDTLYRADPCGRIVASNEWDARPAPRFHLMTTPAGPLWRLGPDVPAALADELSSLARDEPWRPQPHALPLHDDVYRARLASNRPVERQWSGPAFAALGELPPSEALAITTDNAALLAAHFPDWLADVPHRQPFCAVVEDGRAVALCASVRIAPQVHCAGVETHRDHRRRGHAAAAVTAWASAVRSLGATAFYSTSWDNLASRAVAARLGLTLVGADYHLA
jgi:GrpB-like predicted nucleotidyltransferase (UPF0157 family)/RimJ/RimL family protein N-acetyltransferase